MLKKKIEQSDELIKKSLAYKQNGDLINAELCLKQVIYEEPKNFVALNNLGNIYSVKNHPNEAKRCFLKAINIKPDYSNAIFNLALNYEETGKINKAIELYKKAINHDPNNLGIHYNLSRIDETYFVDENIRLINKILLTEKISSFDRSSGFFILAKDQKNKGKLRQELQYLKEGHRYCQLSNEKINNQVAFYWIRLIPNIIKKFKFISRTKKIKKIKPIFITGLPRSGSTLVESIISSGKKTIPNGGETAIINRIFLNESKNFFSKKKFINNKKNLEIIEDSFIKKIIDQYHLINLLDKNENNTFTDKSLENFFFIELIIKLFPESKIIICKRDLLQNIISIYQNFLPGIRWSHSIENILEYIDNYLKIIEEFKKNYPKKIYIIDLNELTKDPKNISKDFFKFCDIEWDKKCMEFYKREDMVSKTASNQQIRSKIFTKNKIEYNNYKEFLYPYSTKYPWLEKLL